MVPPVCLKDRADPRSTLPGEIQPMRDLSVDPLDFHPSIMSYRKRKVLQQCFFSSSKEFDWQVVWVKTRPPSSCLLLMWILISGSLPLPRSEHGHAETLEEWRGERLLDKFKEKISQHCITVCHNVFFFIDTRGRKSQKSSNCQSLRWQLQIVLVLFKDAIKKNKRLIIEIVADSFCISWLNN